MHEIIACEQSLCLGKKIVPRSTKGLFTGYPQYVYSSLRQISTENNYATSTVSDFNQTTTEATYPRLFDGKTTSIAKRNLFIYRKSAILFLCFTQIWTLSLNVTLKTAIKWSLIIHLQSIKVDFCLK